MRSQASISLRLFAFLVAGWLVGFQTASWAQSQTSPLDAMFKAELNSGGSVKGAILGISAEGLQMGQNANSAKTLPYEELRAVLNLRPREPAPQIPAMVMLIDGSTFYVANIEYRNGVFRGEVGLLRLELPAEVLLKIRLNQLNQEQSQGWETISGSAADGDLAALIQKSGALSKIEGFVESIADGVVAFDFDGVIDLPLAKVAGLRFFTPEQRELPRAQAVVEDVRGNIWMCHKLASDGNTLSATLQCGETIELPLAELSKLDFSLANTAYLADLELDRNSARTLFSFESLDLGEDQLFGVQRVPPSWIPGKLTGPGLTFLGSGEAILTIPDGFKTLQGEVNLKPKGNKVSPVKVDISLENKTLWEADLDAADKPTSFEVAIQGGQRLRLRVQGLGDLPVGDIVHWIEPRLVR